MILGFIQVNDYKVNFSLHVVKILFEEV